MQLLLYVVTINASQAAGFMWTPLPEKMRAPRMAFFANGILFGNGIVGLLAEPYRNRVLASASLHMRLARPVACLASQSLLRTMRIQHHHLSHGGVLEAAILIFVAGNAHLVSDVTSGARFRRRLSLRRGFASIL